MSFLLLTLTLLISLGSVVQYAEAISFPPDSRSLSARHFSSGGEYTRPIFGGRDEGILRRERRVHSRQAANSTDATPGGLPTNIIPTHYNLTLEPDFVTYNFDGTVVIDLDVVRDANKITLNFDQTYGSNITEASLSVFYNSSSSVEWKDPTITYDAENGTATFSFNCKVLPKGTKAKLSISFVGILNDFFDGFYRSSFLHADGTKTYAAVTQFEVNSARTAFPCWDEPLLKANFTTSIISPKEFVCISNMDVASETDVISKQTNAVKKLVRFNTTPRMSTYLAAWAIGEMNYIESDNFRIPIRVYAPPSQDIQTGKYALQAAVDALTFYESAYGINFPLPKMDIVAINDFSAGAMENWGIVTFRAELLSYTKERVSASSKVGASNVVAHELAHMWFGDLVTMKWWSDIWLNEGFAEHMSTYFMSAVHPEYELWQQFISGDLQSALQEDSLRTSHAIQVPIGQPAGAYFDSISYEKGACVLRMLSSFIGDEAFRDGIFRYLSAHKYGNTETSDLWEGFSAATGKDIAALMGPWVEKVGFPYVTVTEDGSSIHVEQHRFLVTGDVKPEEDTTIYPLFVNIKTEAGVNDSIILTDRAATYNLSSDLDFFLLNADYTNPWRVNYSPGRLKKLGQQAAQGLLSIADRTGLIADTGALAKAGYKKTSELLDLITALKDDDAQTVWTSIGDNLKFIDDAWIANTEVWTHLRTLKGRLAGPVAHKLGWEFHDEDGEVLQQFKASVFLTAGLGGDPDVVAASKTLFWNFMNGQGGLNPNIKTSVFRIANLNGGVEEYDALINYYRTATRLDEKQFALRSLGVNPSPALVNRTIELLLDPTVRSIDLRYILAGLTTFGSAYQVDTLFRWAIDNRARLDANYSLIVGRIATDSVSMLSTREQLDTARAFYTGTRLTPGLAQNLDGAAAVVAWNERDTGDVRAWFGL